MKQRTFLLILMPWYRSFSYINNGSLTDEYFQNSYSTLDNGYENNAAHVKPTDFVELDYHRKLEFVYEISLRETNLGSGE